MKWMLPDKLFYPLVVLIAVAMFALSTVWPQGLGTRSPAPFGHAEVAPDYVRMVAERDARKKKDAADKAARVAASASSSAAVESSSAGAASPAP